MSCNCISEMNAMLAEHNTMLVTTMFRKPDACVVATDRLQVLRGGKKAALVIASFCPFCGTKYEATGTASAPALGTQPGTGEVKPKATPPHQAGDVSSQTEG